MKVLFIGGSGIISSACTPLAVERGLEVTLFNRGQSFREIPPGVRVLHGDIRDKEGAARVLGDETFDVVVNWIAFATEHIETDLALFQNRTRQYIFISSASAYQTPPARLPVTESTPLYNPVWEYSGNKIACEERLLRAYREDNFPMTVVRPSHTYDKTLLPMNGGYTIVDRMRQGKKVIIYGDGTSLWTLTHHRDFAKGFVGLLGNTHAIGDTFHITSDEILTWNQIFNEVARAAGTRANVVHISSDLIAQYIPTWGDGLLGDKTHSMIFDNTKIKRVVPDYKATIPFARGADEIMAWYDADPARQKVDEELNQQMDNLITTYEACFI
jgi:nucleoside-diphosphate-sugar epimerase